MDQDQTGENGSKEVTTKQSGGTKTLNGRGSSMGPGFAMKLPGKQAPKTNSTVKKGRPVKSNFNKEGQSSNSTTPDLPNGGNGPLKIPKESRRNSKSEKNSLSPSLGVRTSNNSNGNRSQGNSRNNSVSPVNRMDSGDAGEKRQPPSATSKSDSDKNHLTDNLKQLLSIGENQASRIVYSRIQLLNISENPSSKHRPECLDKDFNAVNGRWDPESWHRSLISPTSQTSAGERIHKLSLSESRDRFVDDSSQGGIILGPQRRSFQDGCHVTSSAASRLSGKHHLSSPTEPGRHGVGRPRLAIRQRSEVADYDTSPAQGRERQVESASALRTEEFDWERRGDSRFRERDLSDLRPEPRNRRDLPRDLHELRSGRDPRDGDFRDRDRDFRDRRFSHSREYGGGWYQQRERHGRRYSNCEPEPEWYTDGPTSQSETIELAGFEEETPAAAADFSSWGGEIPMDDLDFPGKGEKKKEEENGKNEEEEAEEKGDSADANKTEEPNDGQEKSQDQPEEEAASTPSTESQNIPDDVKLSDSLFMDDLLNIPGFSAVMEQILKENSMQLPNSEEKPSASSESQPSSSSSSRFSQWFQKDQNIKNESGSGVSTPHEELENLAELAAERGLASPVDVEAKQQQPKVDIMSLLAQGTKSGGSLGTGSISPSLKQPDSLEQQQELARKLLLQQMKTGSVMSAAELEAKAGARQSPSQSYGVDMQNTDAFNKLVASIREKDRQRQILSQQQAMNQFQGKPSNLTLPGGRIPSPEELAAHTQNIFQQALIKKQLEKQKEAYREKVRQIEQQRREEQLREAIRSADAKMQESKQMNKSLAFMPTSVMRKMQESREGKMSTQGQEMMGMSGDAEDLASATASFSAKLAGKKAASNPFDAMNQPGNDLLARIYQSAASGQSKRNDGASQGLRRNASYPEVLMDANKLGRSSAFHQPSQRNIAANSLDLSKLNISGDSETARLRSLLSMSNEQQNANMMKGQAAKPTSLKPHGNVAADIYNNNMLKAESQAGKYDRSSPAGGVKLPSDTMEKSGNEAVDAELKNQHEVALLTQFVLNKYGITEDQLSRLTQQQQQSIVNVVQEQYYLLQAQKRSLAEKKAQKDGLRLKQGDLPSPNVGKHDIQAAMVHKNPQKMDQNDPRMGPIPLNVNLSKANLTQTPNSLGAKFPQQQTAIPGVGLPGLLATANPQIHHLQLRSLVPQTMQFIPPPIARGHPIFPPTIIPPQATHIPGRLMPPPPANVPLASPLGAPYNAAALMQMQFYQQQQQQRAFFAAAAIQQQRMQAFAAARQQSGNKENRSGDFSNPLEKWFGPDVLSQSHLPPPQQKTMTLTDIERANQTNQKQE